MWLGVVLVAIAGVASVFMVRFLVALLRERSPSVCYWVVPELVDDDDAAAQPDEVDGWFETRGWTSSPASRGVESWQSANPWIRGREAYVRIVEVGREETARFEG